MTFRCPECRKIFTMDAKYVGRQGHCPACNAPIVAPDAHDPQSPADTHSGLAPNGPQFLHADSDTAASPAQPPPLPASEPDMPEMGAEASRVATAPKNTPVPPPLPVAGNVLFMLPESFGQRLSYCTEKERRELRGLILGAAIIGLIAGFFWGGVFDPWHGEKKAFTAVLNLLLFGGWGIAEVAGLLVARNFKLVKRQGGLLLAGGISGGLWVALWSAVDMALTPLPIVPLPVNMAIGALAGLTLGTGISVFSSLRLSKLMFIPGEVITHGPVRSAQRTSPPPSPPTSRLKTVLWIAGGTLFAMIFGGVVIGGLLYATLDSFQGAQKKFEVDRTTFEPVTPIPYAPASAEANLLLNGTFQHLDGWTRYEFIAADDVVELKNESNYVIWTRTNSREESGALGVYQSNLHIDVSGAGQAVVDFDVWVGGQMLAGDGKWTDTAGIAGEMPVHVEITYLDADGETFLWDRGFLIYDFAVAKHAEIIEKAAWTHITLDLLDDALRLNPKGDPLPPPATITKVMVYGNGWDFSGAVGNLSIQCNST